jgi:cystathionine beta-lyase/cystathionine gamma-synthase
MNEKLHFSTRAIHAGKTKDKNYATSSPSIQPSVTYLLPPELGFGDAPISDSEQTWIYQRWDNPNAHQLEQRVASLEGGEAAVAFSSGMAAATGLIQHLLKMGDHLVIADTCYLGVAEFVRQKLPQWGIDVSLVDPTNLDEVDNAITSRTKLIWLETPTNPTLRLADIAAIAQIAHAKNVKLAVDSTFATPVSTRPLELGADYVMHALTKYFCGHGDAMGGIVVGEKQAMLDLRSDCLIHQGAVISPFNAWLIARGIETLPLRMAQHEHNAQTVASYLEQHPKVKRVIYPGLASHPQHALAKRQMRNMSGMLTFTVDNGDKLAVLMAQHLRVVHYAVSLGHSRSLVVYVPTDDIQQGSFQLSGNALKSYRAWAGEGIFRTSIGLEHAQDLIADLERVLGLL